MRRVVHEYDLRVAERLARKMEPPPDVVLWAICRPRPVNAAALAWQSAPEAAWRT